MRIGDDINAFGDLKAVYGNKPYKYPWAGSADVFGLGAAAKAKKNSSRRHGMFGMGYFGQQSTEGVPFVVTVASMPGSIGIPNAQVTLMDPNGKFIDVETTDAKGQALILAPDATFWSNNYVLKVTGLPKGYGSPVPAQQAITTAGGGVWAGRNLAATGLSMDKVQNRVTFVVQGLQPAAPPMSPEEQVTYEQINPRNQPPLVVAPPPYVPSSPEEMLTYDQMQQQAQIRAQLSPEEQATWDQIQQQQNQPNQVVVRQPVQQRPVVQQPVVQQPVVRPQQPAGQATKTNVQKASMLPADLEKYMPYILVGGAALLLGFVIFPKIVGGKE